MNLNSFPFSLFSGLLLKRSYHQQQNERLKDPQLWSLGIAGNGHLSVQGIDTQDLAKEFGSPLLVFNKQRCIEDAEALFDAYACAPEGSKILYSYKTNCIPGILKTMHDIGIGAEVISPYELWLAIKLGVSPDMILYNGVDKSDESLELAISNGIMSTNIDSYEEVERIYRIAKKMGRPANVGIRLALASKAQFGLNLENGEALEACRNIKRWSEHLKFNCIHFNVTSNTKDAETHQSTAVKALNFIKHAHDETGLLPEYLDIGGGFGVPTTKNMNGIEYGLYRTFGILPEPPDVNAMMDMRPFLGEVMAVVEKTCNQHRIPVPKLVIEPGRLVTSRSEFLLATVLSVKDRNKRQRFAITNAGRLSVTYPCDFEYHEVFVAQRPQAKLDHAYEIKGRICTSADWMFKNRYLPELKSGDVLAVMDAGAYFSSYSSNFAFPRPPIVMIDDGKTSLIRKEETFDHLVGMDTIEF